MFSEGGFSLSLNLLNILDLSFDILEIGLNTEVLIFVLDGKIFSPVSWSVGNGSWVVFSPLLLGFFNLGSYLLKFILLALETFQSLLNLFESSFFLLSSKIIKVVLVLILLVLETVDVVPDISLLFV